MTITYPLSVPHYPYYFQQAQLTQRVRAPLTVGEFSFAQNVYEHPGKMWQINFATMQLPPDLAAEWRGFIAALHGPIGRFLIGDPVATAPLGSAAGTPVVDGAGQTGSTLATRGWTAGEAGVLLAGDYFQIGSGANARLYMNLTDANADGSGNATLDIFPDVLDQPADGSAIILDQPVGVFRLTSPDQPWRWGIGDTTSFSFEAISVLP